MALFKHPHNDDVQAASGATADWLRNKGWTEVDVIAVDDLKGQQLDDELKARGLPTTGKADEKRARLAEHIAAAPDAPQPDGDGPAVVVDPDPSQVQ